MNQLSTADAPITESPKVLIIDDHPLFREALTTAVGLAYPDTHSREASSIDEAIQILDCDRSFDIALLDLNLPGVKGFDGLLQLRTHHPRLPVLVVSGLEDERIIGEAMTYGAAGFLPKSLGGEVLATAISTIMQGGVYMPEHCQLDNDVVDEEMPALIERVLSLTPQQLRVLFMLREGLLNKQIAYELDVGASTVKKHVSEILRKLEVHSRTQAVIEISRIDKEKLFDMEQRFLKSH